MTNTTGIFQLAQLAEASYANLIGGNDTLEQELKNASNNMSFSSAQAADFVTHWAVVDHLPNTASGFSATLFKRLDDDPVTGAKAGDLVFALRGTEAGAQFGLDLFEADFHEIVVNGLAFRQIIDMYNYWQRLLTPAGGMAKQAVLVPATLSTSADKIITEGVPGVPAGGKWTIEFVQDPVGLGKVQLTENLLAATGHSLGGHLATAFTRLFPAWGKQAVTFNGAGYPTGGEANFRPADIVNLYGDKNYEFVTMNSFFGLMQPGDHQPLFIEQDTVYASTFGHGMGRVADSADASDANRTANAEPSGKDNGVPAKYRALVALKSQALFVDGEHFKLTPGMQVSAEVRLGTRTILEYLLSPVQRAFHEAGRER